MEINSINDFRKAVKHKYAWPGGYPTFFICEDGAALCHDCVKKNRRDILEAVQSKHRNGWQVVALDINYEDGHLFCDQCSNRIESAYGGGIK